MLDAPAILEKTRLELDIDATSAEQILKGGSDRAYWRVTCDNNSSVIVMEYTTRRPDNASFVPVTRYLTSIGTAVPAILALREEELLVWLQDLGGDDLWASRNDAWEKRRPLYKKALAEVAKLHAITETPPIDLQPPFDEDLYGWEQRYFLEEFVAGYCDEKETAEALGQSAEFADLIATLVKEPRGLLHRDFQSQNVMVKDDEVFLIDYQGLRFGVPEYDVASLIYDPYVPFTDDERLDLQHDYCEIRGIETFDEWQTRLHQCAAQRLMQALGAYGYLGIKLKRTQFFQHIPAALKNLSGILKASGLLPNLLPHVERTLLSVQ